MTMLERRDARETVAHPGKFEREHPMVPILYGIVMNGFADDTESVGPHIYDLVGRWILWEEPWYDSQGFVSGIRYDTRDAAQAAMDAIHEEAQEDDESDEEEND